MQTNPDRPIAGFLSSAKPFSRDGLSPNWSHAFHAVLEKRDFQVIIFDRLEALLTFGKKLDIIVVGHTHDDHDSNAIIPQLKRLNIPVLVQTDALGSTELTSLQLTENTILNDLHIHYDAPNVQKSLQPFGEFLGKQPHGHPIGFASIECNYVPPDPRQFAIDDEDKWQTCFAKVGMRQVFAWRH
ncbi:hypothetical protein N9P17_07340, partial [Tateyamaria sp.]|nr:hypothetical protein [Tateyamaria sp.]